MSNPLNIISISHTAVIRGAGRMRYWMIATRNRFTLVVPTKWREYGRLMLAEAAEPELDICALPICLTRAGPAKWYLHFYPGLGRLLRTVRPNVIHLWEEPWSLVALQAVVLRALFLRSTAIVLETEQNIGRRLPPPFERIRRLTQSQTDLLIVRGPQALAVARATGYRGPAEMVEYCVDGSRFNDQGRARARHALGASGLVLGYAGRLVKAKGVAKVIDAVARCRADITFLVLGDGPEGNALRVQAAAYGLGDRLRILQTRPPSEVGEFMRGIDVLVLLSQTTATWKEQFGRVIIEAQACGTPVIGSDSGSVPFVVGSGGWIVGEDDVDGLAVLLDRLADNPAEIAAKARDGLLQVARRFTPDKVAGDLTKAYSYAVGQRCKRRSGAGVTRGSRPGSKPSR